MNETLSDFIKLAAVIALAAALVMVGFRVYNANSQTINSGIEETTRLNKQIEETEWTQYDLAKVTGTEVFTAISRFESRDTWVACMDQSFNYEGGSVATSPGATGTLGEKVKTKSNQERISAAKDKGDAKYIDPSGLFVGYVVRNESTNAIVGIFFCPIDKWSSGSGGSTPTE